MKRPRIVLSTTIFATTTRFATATTQQVLACLLVGCFVVPLAGCGQIETESRIVLTGSSTVAPLAAEIGKRFEASHPLVRVEVQTGGSSRGIRDAQCGVADIGMSSRKLKPGELDGVNTTTIAWDGVAFVIHRDNPVEQLSREELIGIYTGQIGNWQQVGGADAPIVVSSRAEGRSELDLMLSHLGIEASQIKAGVIDGETQQSIKTVTTNRNAIVYTSVGAAQHAAKAGAPLKLLPLDDVPASTQTVQTGDFPLARPLVLINQANQQNLLVDEFIRFALKGDMDDLTESFGYVPPARD